jgi:protease I
MENGRGIMKKAVIVTGKLVQDHEFIYPYYRLKEEGYSVDVAAKDGLEVLGQIGTKIPVTIGFEQMAINESTGTGYDLIIIPGGAKCMEYLRQDNSVLKFIADFHTKGKIVSSICHGAQMLISAMIVRGKKISGYYSIKDDINNAGAEYVDAPVVVDDKIVTCPHYKYLGDWMKKTIEIVNTNTCS